MSQNTNTAGSLEEVIQRHALKCKLRPFARDDWYAFAGCETKTPEIANTEWGVVILDGETVGYHRDDGDDDIVVFQRCFFSRAVARIIAERIANLDNPSDDTIAEYLERIS